MSPSTSAAETLVRELVTHGVEHVVLAPGSRSAPLAFALVAASARGDVRLHVRVDERAAAFTALGLARVGGPSAVVTTSGTAVANLHPAVLEASHSGVPLLVLTADRPHELRGTGANQTTDQVRIFGGAPRFFADVPAPSGGPGAGADLRNLLSRAMAAAVGARSGHAGPVHLNLGYREPLVPDGGPGPDGGLGPAAADESHGRTSVHPAHPDGGLQPDTVAPLVLDRGPRTVVVAGDGAGPAALEVATAGGFPLLAEPSSGVRSAARALGPYRLLLHREELGGRVERAVVFGHPTLSRPVQELLGNRDIEVVVVAPGAEWPDAARNAAHVAAAVRVADGDVDDGWLKAWFEADRAAREAVDGVLDVGALTGPLVARELWKVQRSEEALVVGSSNPIRDLDLVAAPSAGPRVVLANRGLSGIDGTLSTAAGVSLGTGRLARVLLGDLAFLHDAGGLLVGPLEEQPRLQVVVVNDDGGGIFALLEQGAPEHAESFERVFGTPHGADLAALCGAYGVAHERVDDVERLRTALADPPRGRSVLEVPVHRGDLRSLHQRLHAAVDAAVSG